MKYKLAEIIIFLLLLSTFTYAQTSSMKLLAVSENQNVGGVVDLDLETKPGSGKVFIEANLFAKEDTQFSIRMAKELVCRNYDFKCSNKDFFYTVNSESAFISGPSGGAGIALLTYANLANKEIPEDISITGTINSGGYIGVVGGVKEKIEAAGDRGVTKVFIPIGSKNFEEAKVFAELINSTNSTDNETIDLVTVGLKKGVEVIEVGVLDDVLKNIFDIPIKYTDFEVPDYYKNSMQEISLNICNRADTLSREALNVIPQLEQTNFLEDYVISNITEIEIDLKNINSSDNKINLTQNDFNFSLISNKPKITQKSYDFYTNYTYFINEGEKLLNNSKYALEKGDSYSAASYCFGANMKFRYIINLAQNAAELKESTFNDIILAKSFQKENLESINDVQIYSVVNDRISDSEDAYEEGVELLQERKFLEAVDKLAYAKERANTAVEWSSFYKIEGETMEINNETLYEACSLSIKEAEDRNSYFGFYLPFELPSASTLVEAKKKRLDGDLIGCIFYALKSKAEIDAVTSSLGIGENEIDDVLKAKELITKRIIAKQAAEGQFPILGYSYLEYGTSLKDQDPYSTLLYFQLAQEQSNLELYFPKKEKIELTKWINSAIVIIFALLAFLIVNTIMKNTLRRKL